MLDEVSSHSAPIAIAQHWREGGVLVVSVRGELDLCTAPWWVAALEDACAHRPAVLVVDLSEVSFLGATAMTSLLSMQRDIGDSDRFVVVAAGPVTARPLRLLGIDRVVRVLGSLEQALAQRAGGDVVRPDRGRCSPGRRAV